jgi:hypothetical protein
MVPTTTIFSEAGVEIITQPYLVGEELSVLARKASKDWLASLPREALQGAQSLEILNGGRHYYVTEAYGDLLGQQCPVVSVRAKRGHASQDSYGGPAHIDKNLEPGTELYRSANSDWCVRIWQQVGTINSTLLVADTIATGTTLAGVLGWAVDSMERAGSVHNIYVFTIAGASDWPAKPEDGGLMPKLIESQKKLAKYGKSLHVTFCNAKFCLAINGTDLGLEGADIEPRAKAMIAKKWPTSFLPFMRCVVWDWGDRFNPTKFSHHLEEVYTHYCAQRNCPRGLLENIEWRLASLPPDLRTPKQQTNSQMRIGSLAIIGLAVVLAGRGWVQRH